MSAPTLYGFFGPGGDVGRGGRTTAGAASAATAVGLLVVVDDEDKDEVPAVPGVIKIVPSKVVPRIVLFWDAQAPIVGIGGILIAPCVLLISSSISSSGDASRRCNSA